MTPFELWLAGKGPEPTIYAPDTSMGDYVEDVSGNLTRRPWKWRSRIHRHYAKPYELGALSEARDYAAAAEEQRTALAQAIAALPNICERRPLPDEFRCFICSTECATKTDSGLAVCEEHCPD